ncbi:unnamed protein product [Sphagnum balticum]
MFVNAVLPILALSINSHLQHLIISFATLCCVLTLVQVGLLCVDIQSPYNMLIPLAAMGLALLSELYRCHEQRVANSALEWETCFECFCTLTGGLLLLAADKRRNSPDQAMYWLQLFLALTAATAAILSPSHPVVSAMTAAGLLTYFFLPRGHLCWHIASAYALYRLWTLLRRPHVVPITINNLNLESDQVHHVVVVLIFIAAKSSCRRLSQLATALPPELRVSTHVEDLLYVAASDLWPGGHTRSNLGEPPVVGISGEPAPRNMPVSGVEGSQPAPAPSSSAPSSRTRDSKMDIHAVAAAALCLGSFALGHCKVGSIGAWSCFCACYTTLPVL